MEAIDEKKPEIGSVKEKEIVNFDLRSPMENIEKSSEMEVIDYCGKEKQVMGSVLRSPVKLFESSSEIEVVDECKFGEVCGKDKQIVGSDLLSQMKSLEKSSETEVIDESIGGKRCGKEEEIVGFVENIERNGNKRNEKKETDEKKAKRPRNRGNRSKKYLGTNGDGLGLIQDFERQCVCDCDKRGDRVRVVYLREDMEVLRFVGMEEQKKKWIEVYCGLGPVVAKEYDDLASYGHDEKGNFVNFDPRQLLAKTKDVAADGFDEWSCEVVECSEDDDSDAEHVSIQRPAFLVTGEPDFDAGPPQDGLEYLRRVRWETEHIPKVKIAKVEKNKLNKEQTVYMPKIPEIAVCPDHLMPSKQWEDAFLVDFSDLRLALSHEDCSASALSSKIKSIPLVNDQFSENILENVIQENLDDTTINVDETDDTLCSPTCTPKSSSEWPSLTTVLRMEPVARVSMLRQRIKTLDTMNSLCRNDCEWLFALCAAIDTPLDADTSASLRCLLRKCANLRAEKTDLDDEVIMLNILATISGKYFGQSEI